MLYTEISNFIIIIIIMNYEVFEKNALYHIRKKEYRGTLTKTLKETFITLSLFSISVASGIYGNVNDNMYKCLFMKFISIFLWIGSVLRSFMLFHDGGHGSLVYNSKKLNIFFTNIFAILCGTPTDWNKGHNLHHKNVGNMDQDVYDWGETIFHTVDQFEKMSKLKKHIYKLFRHPALFFTMAPVLTWYIKMRLPFELRPERGSVYTFYSKFVNTLSMIIRYYISYKLNIFTLVLVGDYLAMFFGIILFHFQHVYDKGYVIEDNSKWKLSHAAFIGSSYLYVPEFLKIFTLGIEYHHIHHANIKVPGYLLRKCHEDAPENTWKNVGIKYLEVNDMMDSIYMTLWDSAKKTFVPF